MSLLRIATAFCSACLLFVVQPLLAKWLLPAFGGSPSTWAACMVFFQGMLLAGYAYAHLLARMVRTRLAFALHALFVLSAAVWTWRAPALAEPAAQSAAAALHISAVLLARAGAPYLMLASSAPLLQLWAALDREPRPHRLYAVSNVGSLLALLAYPALIEASWPIAVQFELWRVGCTLLAAASLLCATAWLRAIPTPATSISAGPANDRASGLPLTAADGVRAVEPEADVQHAAFLWLAGSFVPSVLLLAVTAHITVDIAATPLLWVVPLALYLLGFIFAFAGIGSHARLLGTGLWIVASLGLGYNAFAQGGAALWRQLGFPLLALFNASLLCCDVLVRTRPAPARLTGFYLWIAAGGALGGVFVSWLAPLLFRDYYELELSTLGVYLLLLFGARAGTSARPAPERRWLFAGLGVCLPLLAAALLLRSADVGKGGRVLERRRSFLGALRVTQLEVGRMLTHGRIRHGMQLSAADKRTWPTMYFGAGTALARVLRHHAITRPRRIAVVGLGVGTIAAYGRAGDVLRFYELDPNVLELAQTYFSFLRDSPARSEFVLGDGRLRLAHETPHAYDVLVLDAFASDSVPVHLLTREAFASYARQLAPDGVLLANVSNRHLAVDRVVRAAARTQGFACQVVETAADASRYVSKVRWAVMARSNAQLTALLQGLAPAAISGSELLWTDQRASLWVLR